MYVIKVKMEKNVSQWLQIRFDSSQFKTCEFELKPLFDLIDMKKKLTPIVSIGLKSRLSL